MASATAREMTTARRAIDAQAAPALKDLAKNYDTIIRATEAKARALAKQIEAMHRAGQTAQITKGQLYRMERYMILLADLRAQTNRYALDVAAPRIAHLQSDST